MSDRLRTVPQLVEHAAHVLPAQGPITAFVHHNTLHAYEGLPFDEAVKQGATVFGCEPYLTEERYREELQSGRIRQEDLEAVLRRELGARAEEPVADLAKRLDLRLTLLEDPVRLASDAELHWLLRGSAALRQFRSSCPPARRDRVVLDTRRWVLRELRGDRSVESRAHRLAADLIQRFGEKKIEYWGRAAWDEVTLTLLWRVCRAGVRGIPSFAGAPARAPRPRDWLRAATGDDTDLLVHGVLIRFCAAFADQGLAGWDLPAREEGFLRAFIALYGRRGFAPARETWLAGLAGALERLDREVIPPEDVVEESLLALGIEEGERAVFMEQTLLALRGWAGMLWQLESRGDRVSRPAPRGTLLEFCAVRLLLDRLALAHVARETLGYSGDLAGLRRLLATSQAGHGRGAPRELTVTQRTFIVFLLAQSQGWSPRLLFTLDRSRWESILEEIETFSGIERRRVFHLAYERRHRVQALDAIAAHQERRTGGLRGRAELQVVCCIDEREESLRRHVEEIAPGAETFGAAGFFGVAMDYRGVGDARSAPLCPVAVRPMHSVRERPARDELAEHERGAALARLLGRAAHRLHSGSRGFLLGWLAAVLGSMAALPLVARVLLPRLSGRLRHRAGMLVRRRVHTELDFERSEGEDEDTGRDCGSGDTPAGADVPLGFTPGEMAQIVERVLRDIGLTRALARLVAIVGHGSSSLNNPHESAHDCGACGGGRGGPNARVFARMANHEEVRRRLRGRGLTIPEDTTFIGAYHDTCADSIAYYDIERLPASHEGDFGCLRSALERALARNAHERCRRFRTAPLSISEKDALQHVEARSEDLAQPRPEFGHATNALCVVGRRDRTRGLFMDRRAFLVSYDPESDRDDAQHAVLSRLLEAVVPVCGGINLEYYFSYVDPTGWGCGTKLPHNIAALLGVMDGSASDLRAGLPWQMVEIHEPVRLLIVVETTPAALTRILERNDGVGRFCRTGWVQLATLDPQSAEIHVFEGDRFVRHAPESPELPETESSARWYGGLREHLEFASIRQAAAPPRTREEEVPVTGRSGRGW